METIANIKKYKHSFTILSKNPENMFSNYLKKHNLTEIEFLFQIGLNKDIVTEHNFSEIEKLISLVLAGDSFPYISFPMNGESIKKDNLSI